MILHINQLLISIFLIFSSCTDGNKTELKYKEVSNITKADTVQQPSKTFVFYKAFGFFNSNVEYFTPEEARNLYAEKTISIDLKSSKIEYGSVADTNDRIECIKENLSGKSKLKFLKPRIVFLSIT